MFAQIKELVNKNKQKTAMAAIAVVMFVLYLIMPMTTPETYISPDETANAYFATTFAEEGKLWYTEPLNLDAFDRLHPRATESHGGLVSPSGFWGMSFIYGLIGGLTSVSFMHILTALIAIIASFLFKTTIAKVCDEKIAWISWVLLLTHPAWWYYAMRGWHHNILFVSLLITLLYGIIVRPFTSHASHSPSVGVMMDKILIASSAALAIFVRPSAILWLIPILAIATHLASRRTKKLLIAAIVTSLIAAAALWMVNTSVFGSLSHLRASSSVPAHESSFITQIFPDGFQIKTVARSIGYYFFIKIWWFTIPMLIALTAFIPKHKKILGQLFKKTSNNFGERRNLSDSPFAFGRRAQPTQQKDNSLKDRYLLLFAGVTVMLLLWYGSWNISDNPDPRNISLANSYMRYWLPAFVLSIPCVAIGIQAISKKINHTKGLAGLLVVMIGISGYTVASGNDGVINNISQLKTNHEISQKVNGLIPSQSIIITNRHDKLFFPDHKILFPIDDPGTFETIRALKRTSPIFVYNLKFSEDELSGYNGVLKQLGLRLQPLQEFGNEQLYRITSI